jgi:hypothetical protein
MPAYARKLAMGLFVTGGDSLIMIQANCKGRRRDDCEMARKKDDNVVVVIDVGGQNRGGVGRNTASRIFRVDGAN